MASYPSGTAYHADSDADDEFEQRSVMTSPTQLHTDSETSSEPPSNEHTPTTFGAGFDDGIRPRTVITEWLPEDCAHFIASMGLRQYSDAFIEHGIDGEALTALNHDELKEMGITSAGHRLKILKDVYDIKVQQDVPIKPDEYVPLSAEKNPSQEPATKDDILKLTSAIMRLRDERIVQLETQLTKLADDSRKLRTELWPLFKMVKENQPLPYRPNEPSMGSPEYVPETMVSPPLPSAEAEKPKSSLTRTFSKKLGLTSSTPKNHSPTHFPNTIHEGRTPHDDRPTGLQPSAAASAASNQLTAGMQGGLVMPHHSPNPNSPTTPGHQHQALSSRSYQRDNSTFKGRYDGADDSYHHSIPTPPLTGAALNNYLESQQPTRSATTAGNKLTNSNISNASTLIPSREMSASVPPQSSSGGLRPSTSTNTNSTSNSKSEVDADDPSVQIFKSFRVALDDPCWKVLPAALRKYNINADWRQYALYIVYGDQERCVGLEEKPLALFKDLDREGKKPMFMLRKLANGIGMVGDLPAVAGSTIRPQGQGGGGGGGLQSSAASVRTMGQERTLPGGII
ncbi:hypothetical protein PMZ80_008560 [Knufia obscura]|uniref:Uncharacterized protein n=2 Tax=Knufia TaxID=430999 RepID=A0AAN8F5U0_9EURO|nr:hypothetical protein PMZ80_008560 [Knufia obscura]KAK5952016.1 hypothetical protein OHC33_006902 [Knufia fluminis]